MSTTTTYHEDEHVWIRRYEPSTDESAVQRVFQKSMRTLIPLTVEQFALAPVTLFSTALSSWLVHRVVLRVASGVMRKRSHSRDSMPWAGWWAWTASFGTILLSYASLRRQIIKGYGDFLNRSVHDDLVQVQKVYLEPGGNFLVAVDRSSGEIVGCVGGELKATKENLNEDASKMKNTPKHAVAVYELRRMVVDPNYQRRSVARRLLSCLEANLLEQQQEQQQQQQNEKNVNRNNKNNSLDKNETEKDQPCIHIFLTCSDVQRAAHRLYTRCGFRLTDSYPPKGVPWWVRSSMRVYRFEKSISLVCKTKTH